MIHTWILILSVFAFSAHATDFTHIKLNPQFEQYLNQPKLKSISKSAKSATAPAVSDEYSQRIKTTLLGAALGGTSNGDFTSPFPTDGETSPLYEEIRNQLEAAHQEIGLREVTNLDFLNTQFNLGAQNFSGFSWQKPFGVVHVFADRQVVPNILGSNYLVSDTFTVDVEATTFIEGTNAAGITAMSATEIGAFAGVTFKRVYTYYHYANSYNEGLRADFSKLFLPFLRMNSAGVARMNHEEIIKREDNWTAKAGGLITSPAYYGFSASGGVLAQFAYQNMVSIQNNLDPEADADKVRLVTKGKTTTSVGVNASIQLDFFKLLQITILNYDLTYEYARSKEFTLGMTASEWQHANEEPNMKAELKNIIHGYGHVQSLEPYVTTLEDAESSGLAQRGSLLIWGRLAKSKTEKVTTIGNNSVRVFFKSYAQNMRVVQNIFSRLFSAVIYKLLKLPVGTTNAALYNRQVNMEYEAIHPQASDINIARVNTSEEFSFSITQSYEAARTDRWIDKRFKNDLIWFVDSFTTLPKDYMGIIRSGQLKGPMMIESKLLVEKIGFEYLLNTDHDIVFGLVAGVCKSGRVEEWKNETKRNKFLNRLQIGKELCVKNIGTKFLEFKNDYLANAKKPSLAKFKSFLTKYYKQAENLTQISALFSEENTFIHGQLKGTTPLGTQFVLPFSSGQFRGLGVIDNFKRSNGSRQPASIVSE